MHVILEIPIDAFLLCTSRSKIGSDEYIMLRNGITLRDHRGRTVVHIRCDAERVTPFMNMVSEICPEFMDKIRKLQDPHEMKLLVEIPIGLHCDIVGKCEVKSPNYLMLKNGVIGHDGEVGVVTILCDPERANQIVALANEHFPFAGNRIVVKPFPTE